MVTEILVIDHEVIREGDRHAVPVVSAIEAPPKASSAGWGDMSWALCR